MKFWKSQKGFGFIMAVLGVGVIIMGFLFASARYYASLTEESARFMRMMAVTEVAQNLSIQIRHGYHVGTVINANPCPPNTAVFNLGGGGPNLPPGPGDRYCLPDPVCVSNPLGGLDSTGGEDQICWSPGDSRGEVVVAGYDWPFKKEVYARWNQLRFFTGEILVKATNKLAPLNFLLTELSGESYAQLAPPEQHLPRLPGGVVPVNLTPLDCSGADSLHCMRCRNGAGPNNWGERASCVELDLCLIEGGCANEDDRIIQWLGLVR